MIGEVSINILSLRQVYIQTYEYKSTFIVYLSLFTYARTSVLLKALLPLFLLQRLRFVTFCVPSLRPSSFITAVRINASCTTQISLLSLICCIFLIAVYSSWFILFVIHGFYFLKRLQHIFSLSLSASLSIYKKLTGHLNFSSQKKFRPTSTSKCRKTFEKPLWVQIAQDVMENLNLEASQRADVAKVNLTGMFV